MSDARRGGEERGACSDSSEAALKTVDKLSADGSRAAGWCAGVQAKPASRKAIRPAAIMARQASREPHWFRTFLRPPVVAFSICIGCWWLVPPVQEDKDSAIDVAATGFNAAPAARTSAPPAAASIPLRGINGLTRASLVQILERCRAHTSRYNWQRLMSEIN
jgi:hypothetical protein